jgi:leucyl-tRNA synthetase
MAKETFDHRAIEPAEQAKWEESAIYSTDVTDTTKDPYYLLFEFPYPSGDLHIGHWYAFALTDIYARMLRMQGKQVLFPIGFDAFGLPAENAALKHGVDPGEWTYANMERMRTQIRSMGTSVDWSREVVTCDPEYYRWTQWLFSRFYEHNLAERRNAAVKWCPKDQTVLANEQVRDGACERCGTVVEEKYLTQWFLKITQYAKRLLTDLDPLPWREDIKDAQRAWIGESEGAKLTFPVKDSDEGIEVFTTRPDTLYGVTYLVLAPEHQLVEKLLPAVANASEVEAYRKKTEQKSERERSENKEKTGVELVGVHALHPITKEELPVYVADYVLASYGTGAVMAVPAHDERDYVFAKSKGLPIKHVIIPRCIDYTNPQQEGKELVFRKIIIGIVHNPVDDTYLTLKWKDQPWTTFITGGVDEGEDVVEAARREIAEETGYTDLTFVRQLGGPTQAEFFAAHKDVNRTTHTTSLLFTLKSDTRTEVSEEEKKLHSAVWLPRAEVTAERMQHAETSLLLSRIHDGVEVYLEDGVLQDSGVCSGKENREALEELVALAGGELVTNYRLRDWLVSRQRYWGCPIPVVYDPEGKAHLVPSEHLPWLLPTDVDFTATGVSPLATSKELKERVVRIFGEGWTPEYDTLDTFVDSSWYYLRYLDPKNAHDFTNQALLKQWMPIDRYSGGSEHTTMHLLYARFMNKALYDMALVPTSEPFHERFNRGLIMGPDGQKMSKSKGNVVNPDEVVEKYGSDAVRMYLAFIGPYNEPGSYPWKLDGVDAMRRFLDRIYLLRERTVATDITKKEVELLGVATKKISEDTERFKLNTAVSGLMVLVRGLESEKEVSLTAYRSLLALLAPYAPHLSDHLWTLLEGEGSVHVSAWPTYEPGAATEVTIGVQVKGKKRGEIQLSVTESEEGAVALARGVAAIELALGNRPPVKVVYVPGRILNLIPADDTEAV